MLTTVRFIISIFIFIVVFSGMIRTITKVIKNRKEQTMRDFIISILWFAFWSACLIYSMHYVGQFTEFVDYIRNIFC